MRKFLRLATTVLATTGAITAANAHPVNVESQARDQFVCDPIFLPSGDYHELGVAGAFPQDEAISVDSFDTDGSSSCQGTIFDDPGIENTLVQIRNDSNFSYFDLWFVAGEIPILDPPFELDAFANVDAIVAEVGSVFNLALRIDDIGSNTPLVFESGAADGIFDPGEIWGFVVVDWRFDPFLDGQGLGRVFIDTIGLLDEPAPTASIIGRRLDSLGVPEPGTLALFGIGLVGMGVMRRRRKAV